MSFNISFDINSEKRINNPACEVLIDDVKYHHKQGILYTVRTEPKSQGPWTLAKWCDHPVEDGAMIHAFLSKYVDTFGKLGKNKQYADKLFKLTGMPINNTGRVVFRSVLRDKVILAFESLGHHNIKSIHIIRRTLEILGATPEDVLEGYAYDPVTKNRRYMKGIIGMFIANNCPHAQPYWNKWNALDAFLPEEHEALFINPRLGELHNKHNWLPGRRSGGGRYSYDPAAAAAVPRPPQEQLEAAVALRAIALNTKSNNKGNKKQGPSALSRNAVNMTFC